MTREGQTATERHCDGTKKPGSLPLPVLGTNKPSKIRKSRSGRWRAISLTAVHVLMIAHLGHYLYAGKTLSPVEPSETMYTLRNGELNAGAIFFLVAMMSVAIFGRFFCGWGCHLLAYQDLCAWLMKRIGIKPQPFRSRLMLWIPFGAAVYMFLWPTFARVFLPELVNPFPGFSNHLMTTEYWKTFPGPVFSVLTVIACGFVAVYFLGSKAFCSYSCPYGGFFAPIDKLSAGRILVTDACEQCGHCTATCTSNVRVHEEVKHYGMVVDPGCMKCMDCVSVCPNDALYFGFTKPSLKKKLTGQSKPRKYYDLSLGAEVVFLVIFLAAMVSFRGIYGGPPFLMALPLGALTAFLCFRLWAMIRKPTVRIQNLKLKTAGRMATSGYAFSAIGLCWVIFTAHCGFIQYHRHLGQHYRNQHLRTSHNPLPNQDDIIKSSYDHFMVVDAYGLFDWAQIKVGLASYHYFRHEDVPAETYLEEALAIAPESMNILNELVRLRFSQGKVDEALATLEQVLELDPDNATAHFNLGGNLRRLGHYEKAVVHLEKAADLLPENVQVKIELGDAYFRSGRIDDAITVMSDADKIAPNQPQIQAYLDMFHQQRPR